MRPGVGRFGAIPGRMACVLAVALLTCAFAAHAQVIEEGGFPVKGGGVSGESFSLICPSRLAVQAGSSIVLSCSATAVPEEGVRYEWESLSGDGFHLLSASDELSPLFTAPLSGESAEYGYRLTAMGAGVYATASVTVTVQGVPGESVGAPVIQKDCDPFTIPDELGEGCAEDKGPVPFGFGPESEGGFLFPEAPGLPDRPSGPVRGGGLGRQTPPYLECPVAVFLEELETGAIECRVSDASGEEYLEYVWEPVGNTTRDYLENPRLMPEDAPNPSVVAPETPVYETLESFHSGETTFRYRYRLTATSRATGLSSSSEVEVFVSSSRPSVYCPLEVVVEEGETVSLDCEGVDPLSARMDYDEEGASIWWEWEGLWGTSTDPLSATELSSPLFTAPAGSAGKQYHYVASMTSQASGVPRTARRRVTVTVTGVEEETQAAADASALANKGRVPVITCNDPPTMHDVLPFFGETEREYKLDCSVTDEPTDPTYRWDGPQPDKLLTNRDTLHTTFNVPNITIHNQNQQTQDYTYTVTLSAPDLDDDVTETVTITLEEREVICWVTETTKLQLYYNVEVDEGRGNHELTTCEGGITSAEGEPYIYVWDSSVPPASGNLSTLLTATDQQTVSFIPPSDLPRDIEYVIGFHVTRPSEPDPPDNYFGTSFRITVKNLDPVECNDPSGYVYEETDPFEFDCTDKMTLSNVTWEWGPPSLLTHLTHTDRVTPTFTPPPISTRSERFRYTVRAKVGGVDMGGSEVTVRMLAKHYINLDCDGQYFRPEYEVYEGAEDFPLNCSATGASGLTYAWTGRGSTVVPGRLSRTDRRNPTFDVPDDVDADQTYEYTLTISGQNAHDRVVNVKVTVKNKPDIVITCPGNPYSEYEGEENFELDCSAIGVPSGSTPEFEWTGRGSTVVPGRLSSTTIDQPTFDVPGEVAADETYEYTLVVSADNAQPDTEDVTVTVKNKSEITVTCSGNPYSKYEGEDNFDLDCSAIGAPSGSDYVYEWTARGGGDPDKLIAGTDGPTPTFEVPEEVDSDETYEYTLTVSAEGAKDDVANVTVTVKKKPDILVTCTGNPYSKYEGEDNFDLDCTVTGVPSGSDPEYEWTARGSTSNTDKLIADTDGPTPTFEVPEEVDSDETYEYTLTVSAENAEDGVANVTVRVLNKPSITVTCPGNPYSAYEGEGNIFLDCEATGKPSDSDYVYEWTARGTAQNTDKLSSTTIAQPTFEVPGSVNSDETYEYMLTVSADNAEDGFANVTVEVLKKATLTLVCTSPPPVYEGSPDFDLNCSATGAPEGSDYDYVWTGRGSTVVPGKLSSTTVENPTFDVPDNVNADTDYEYTLTVSARGADPETANVTVRVLNKPSLTLVCTPPAPVYEGAADFDLDCVASGAPQGSTYDYVWTGRGSTVVPGRLNSTTIAKPTFDVPEEVDGDETYEYTLTVSAENAEDASAPVTVRVLNKPSLTLVCTPPAPVYEGAADFDLNCSASGAPSGSQYDYVWTGRGSTVVLGQLSSTTVEKPTFNVPPNVNADTDYEYTLTVSADNAEAATEDVTVTVLNKKALEVACATPSPVYEGSEDFALDCAATGAPAGSDYTYVWTGRGTTSNTDLLISGTDGPTPTFDVPEEVDEDETYEYLLTVSAENAESATAEVTVQVLKLGSIALICASPPLVYEGSEDFELVCSVSGDTGDTDYTYEWTARGVTANTDLLSATDSPTPTFAVPDQLDETTTYEYLLTASAENAEDATAEVTVTVLNRGALDVACAPPPLVYEGAEDFDLDCTASGAPVGTGYEYVWTARGTTSNTDLLIAGTDGPTPTFEVPEEVDGTTTYEYLLTVSAENAESASTAVTVTVLNHGALSVVCVDPPSVYEGSEDFDLDCSASGAPAGSGYAYVWTARGSPANTALLIAGTDGPTPTFEVPEEVDETTTYEYLLTASAENAEDGSATVTVTVLNTGALRVVCVDPPSVYEGSEDFALDCSASGAPAGSNYEYAWTARGSPANTDLLTDKTLLTPTFLVPDDLPATTTYEYLLTVSADNAEDATAEVTVTVLNRGALSVVCADPPSIYEGSEDFALDCSASGARGGSDYTYAWTARGSTANTAQLSAADISSPTFYVPDELDATTTYEYLLTVSAENTEDATAEVSVTVLNRGPLSVVCTDPGSIYEGSADFELDCSPSGAPSGSDYAYAWTARESTANTDRLSATDISSPTFYVPDEVDEDETYEYLLTVSADNAEDGTVEVTVTVLSYGPLRVVCADPPSVYEGTADFALDCTVSGAPGDDPVYMYAWTARGSTANTDQLSETDISSPTFYVPDEVDATTTYEYLLTASAEKVESGMAEVTVTVLNREMLSVTCKDTEVYEGEGDITLDCSASGAPSGSDYTYVWTARGGTANTDLLITGTDGPTPTFSVPDEVDENGETYEYLLTVSADNAEDASAEVTVTVLNSGVLALVCAMPPLVYEGAEDFAFDCTASGAPGDDPQYAYVWTARGDTPDTALLISGTDGPTPTFAVPDEVNEDETYEYLLTVSADNAESASAEVTVTVLNREMLSVTCKDTEVYEGEGDITLDCSASGAPSGSDYTYVWTARGGTANTDLLITGTDGPTPTFSVPDEVNEDETYEYLLTVSADNAESASAEVTVMVLNSGVLALVCAMPPLVYEGAEDFAFDCTASGAPGDDPQYAYVWTARGDTPDTALLISGTDGPTPTFAVPDEVNEDETYEYLLTVSAANAESASAEVTVMVLALAPLAFVDDSISGRVYVFTVGEVITDILLPEATSGLSPYTYTLAPALPEGLELDDPTRTISGTPLEVSPRTEYTWQVVDANAETVQIAFFIEVVPAADTTSPPVAESSPEVAEASSLGVTVSASSLRFGVQSADTEVSLDPMTDGISTHVSGLYHGGRMTLSLDGSETLDENGEMDLSIELVSPVVLRREGGIEGASIILSPQWSLAESCEQLSSQTIGGLYTEVTLSDVGCRLLRFGGELDLTDVPSGRYTGSMDLILRSGESEETHSVDVDVTVIPVQRVITIGPTGVRFSTSREIPVGLTEEQNLSIYPHVAFLTEEKPNGSFELSNPSLIPLEVSVSARFGYTEATENGREVVVEDVSGSHLGDLSEVVDIHPGVLVLMPGEKGLVRYGMQEGALAAMAEKGYAAFFDVVSEPRQYVRSDQMPEEVTGDRTARVTMRVPGVYVPGEGASQLRAALLSISYVGSLSATFLVETLDHPFAGEVVAYDGDGRELGRRETLVYTRSRVRIPLDRMPEEGAVFLRFSPRGSDRVPEPASVEWDAPRRDIGAAEDKDRTRTPETLVQRP